jgi:hypothetical protein
MACWADEDEIVCVHPGGPRLVGAQAIRVAFEAMFAQGAIRATPERVRRTSRFSLADFFGAQDVLVAIAGDRLAGVQEMYDLPAGDSNAPGDFHLIPLEQIRRR